MFSTAFRRAFSIGLLGLASLAGAGAQQTSDLANVEVLIVRHAEREGILDKLTRAGDARAGAYATYFKTLKLDGREVHITHLIAEKSVRTRHTLEPLAKAMDMPLDTRFADDQYQSLADDLKTHSYGNEVLICWHHGKIPALIRSLGGDPDLLIPNGKWPKSTYDWLVDLRFDADGKLSSANESLIHEHLMPGDPN